MEPLTPRVAVEQQLKGAFHLSCCTRPPDDTGTVRAHTLRRASMHVEDGAMNLPPRARLDHPDPAVTRDGDRVPLDGRRPRSAARSRSASSSASGRRRWVFAVTDGLGFFRVIAGQFFYHAPQDHNGHIAFNDPPGPAGPGALLPIHPNAALFLDRDSSVLLDASTTLEAK